ncbi:DUF1737 domain-containing protein [Tranquillimonas alkanivorans]|uniref:DUF1737 domain-containing protein n=1 Tax=Tranquillimonas alkanivorans TaxID=441119 RepID=A0A1I5QX56_9RHOB|nr:DUF1737 domain-containing protein [Tranquillimonas alkanivorans]SFP50631.1 protein of unknown function [Tranquillimonas alkanivorans]
MARIKRYTVLSALYREDADTAALRDRLSKQVEEYLAAGWQPHGSMNVGMNDNLLVLMQPMVKYQSA